MLYYTLFDHTLEYYKEHVKHKAENQDAVSSLMGKEINSAVRKEAIRNKLEAMHNSQFQTDERSEEEALKHLAQEIMRLTSQAPWECRNDRCGKRILYNGIRGRVGALQVTWT